MSTYQIKFPFLKEFPQHCVNVNSVRVLEINNCHTIHSINKFLKFSNNTALRI